MSIRHFALALGVAIASIATGAAPAAAQNAPPSAPGLAPPKVAACTPFGLGLAWTASTDDVAVVRYDVLVARQGFPSVAANVFTATPQPAAYTHFVDGAGTFKLFDGQTYTVAIRAVDSAGLQTLSATQTVTMPPVILSPTTGLQGSLVRSQVPLRWDAHPSACAYAVHRDDVEIARLPAGTTTYLDAAPLRGRSLYGVHAVGRSGALGDAVSAAVSEPLPRVAVRPTCAWRDTPISARRLSQANIASVCLMNHRRVRAGLQPMWVDPRLQTAAGRHARDMAARRYFSHTSPEGCNSTCRAKAAGYPQGTGEILAAGAPTAAETVDDWMGSAGHRFNILDPEYRTVGSGTAMGGLFKRQWAQTFGPLGAPFSATSAISGLEARYQGSANPDAPVSAGLRVRAVSLTRAGRLKLTATITSRADGGRVRIRVQFRGRTVSYSARIAAGRVRSNRTLPGRVRGRPITVTVSYSGSSRVRAASVRRRIS